jgi:hypothetical protein
MSRLRANEVLNKDATAAFLATEGMNVPAGKNINFNDLSEVTVLDGTSLTTTTLNVDQINLGDNDTLRFGDDQDLQIYHDGSNSYISDQGTGLLSIDSSFTRIRNALGTKNLATFSPGTDELGGVQLYFNGNKKFETTVGGVSVTGDTAVTGAVTSTEGWAGTTSTADVLGGIVMPFTCGLNGRVSLPPVGSTLIFGGSEYSGGGDNHEGVTMPHAGKLYAVTVHAEQAVGDLYMRATVNGTQNSSYEISFSSPIQSNPSPVQTFYSSPLTFAAGDRINFAVSNTTLTQLQVLTLTFFVKFD